jgi:peptidoglycan/xylan/chitin deacetylase (PgdA/CDA1 family)
MNVSQARLRLRSRYHRTVTAILFRRPLQMHNALPYVSFTFDDFPRSALHTAGGILERFGLRATYYASFGLMDTEAPTGTVFAANDIEELLARGHELGCHTFGHCDALDTGPRVFEDSIVRNGIVLNELFPGAVFSSFSYPISSPRLGTKNRAGRHFRCCRGGGQTFNAGVADLNLLKAYFLEKSRDNLTLIKETIDQNCQARGWLILATHDVSESPTPYGCKPSSFEDIVNYSVNSGARILPAAKALEAIRADAQK